MKLLLIFFLMSTNCFGAAFAPLGKAGFSESTYPKFHENKNDCELVEGVSCYDIEKCPLDICEVLTEITQDELGINVETKVLKPSEVKKAEREAIRESKKIAKEAKMVKKAADKVELFALKKSDIDAMTVSQRNAVMIKLINIVQEIEE